jgi:hypothetical protein
MAPQLLLAAFLFLHGAIHLGYLSPRPPATVDGSAWPFSRERSWILTPLGVSAELCRIVGLALTAATLAAFTLAATSVLGLLPVGLWDAAIVLGAGSSIGLLVLFFHPWLVLGIVIDVALLGAVLIADWSPTSLTR